MRLLLEKDRLRAGESLDHAVEFYDMLEFIVVPHNPVTQPAAGSDDQARYTDEGVEKMGNGASGEWGMVKEWYSRNGVSTYIP